jgi:hypothetical protein
MPYPAFFRDGSFGKSGLFKLYPLYLITFLKSLKVLTFLFKNLKIIALSDPDEENTSPYNSRTKSSFTELFVSEKNARLKDA